MRLVEHRPDPVAGGALLEHLDGLHRLARHLTGHAAEAEDLVQETYARACRGMAGFTLGRDLRAWLYRILRNAFLDQRRREGRLRLEGQEELEEVPGPTDGLLRGDAELERLRGLVAEEIDAALHALGEEARLVVLLDQQGFGEAEIAQVMGCPAGTVKSRLFRARAALRRSLREYRP